MPLRLPAPACLLALMLSGCATLDNFAFLPDTRTSEPPARLHPAVATNAPSAAFPEADHATPIGWPIEHPDRHVISPFGPRGRRHHNGIDLKAPRGVPVVATAGGTVRFAGSMRGYGHVVIIDHGGGIETLYAHLREAAVRRGQAVRRGDPLGPLGSTGRTTTHHVHYEVRVDGTPVDPAPYLHTRDTYARTGELQ